MGFALLRSPGTLPVRSILDHRVQSGRAPRTLDAPPPGSPCGPPGSPAEGRDCVPHGTGWFWFSVSRDPSPACGGHLPDG